MEELKLTHALADVIPFAYGLDHLTKHPDLLAEALALDWEDPRLPVWMAGWLSRAFLRAHQVHDEELPLQALRLTGVAVAWASWKLEAIAFWEDASKERARALREARDLLPELRGGGLRRVRQALDGLRGFLGEEPSVFSLEAKAFVLRASLYALYRGASLGRLGEPGLRALRVAVQDLCADLEREIVLAFYAGEASRFLRESLDHAEELACAAHSFGLEEGRYLEGRLRVLAVFAAVVAWVATHGA